MQPLTFLRPVLYTVFLWWFVTGLVMVPYGRSPHLKRLWFAGATLILGAAFAGLLFASRRADPLHVYLAATCGIAIWGWHTASYYFGYVTGPKLPARPQPRGLAARFRRALRASLYHELAILACALLLAAVTWSAPNRWGLWMFLALWLMHLSSKLNIFLGVRNFYIEFLPAHLHSLKPLLGRQPTNGFMPVAVVLATSITLLLIYRAIAPGTPPADAIGRLLVSTMLSLGILEHVLLVAPLPATLWGWQIRPLPQTHDAETAVSLRQPNTPLHPLPKCISESEAA